MSETQKKRRSREEVAFDNAHKEAWQENRARIAAAKQAAREEIARQRKVGATTRLAESKRRAKAAGDPLNLTGHTPAPRLSAKARKQKKKEQESRYVNLVIPSGATVKVDMQSNPLAGVYKNGSLTTSQFAAAQRYRDDFEASGYSGMRCRGFEPGVDGGGIAQANLASIDAQTRLRKLRESIGEEYYLMLEAIVARGLSINAIYAAGGGHKHIIGRELRRALDKTSIYYGYLAKEDDSPTIKALQKLLTDMLEEAGER
jgi:hypothetical protein